MNKRIFFCIALAMQTLSIQAQTDSDAILVRVIDESGRAIPEVSLLIDGKPAQDTDIARKSHHTLAIRAPGYYPAYQTISNKDFDIARAAGKPLPPIILVARKPERVMMVFAGDTMAGRRYIKPLPGEPALLPKSPSADNLQALFRFMQPYFELADLASLNLETQLIDKKPTKALPKSVTFKTHPNMAQAIHRAGIDYVALGNNHLFDFGSTGLDSTLRALDAQNLPFSGAGNNEQQARQPAALKVGDQTFQFLSYVGWPGTFTPNQVAQSDKGGAAWGTASNMQQDLAQLKGPSVVQYHGGLEYSESPSLIEQTRLRHAVDSGASLVVAHHPHVLQGLELHNNKLIAYSMGNFMFDQYIYSTQLSNLLYVWLDNGNFHRAELAPIYLNGYVPTAATGALRYDILQRMRALSDKRNLKFVASGTHAAIWPATSNKTPSVSTKQLTLPEQYNRAPISLRELGIGALDLVSSVHGQHHFRVGVDMLKRGSLDHWQEYGTLSRTWLMPAGVTAHLEDENPHLVVKGSATTGMRTFERAFQKSNPATASVHVETECEADVTFYLQRRNPTESRANALRQGQKQLIGTHHLAPETTQTLSVDFDMPRRATKGVRMLYEIKQADNCQMKLDDMLIVEWRTSWLHPQDATTAEIMARTQRTHLQLAAPAS